MTPGCYVSALLIILLRAQGELTCAGDLSFNSTNVCSNGYDDALQGTACWNECIAPGDIEELEASDHDILEDEDAYGVQQVRDDQYQEEIEKTMVDMKVYFQNLRSNPNTTDRKSTRLNSSHVD